MQAANPYTAPQAPVSDPASDSVSTVNIWSAKGRLGRIRYIAYSIGLGLLINLLTAFVGSLFGGTGVGGMVMIAGAAGAIYVHALLSIQRAHDFNTTGWLAILAFIPLLNFIFWFVPGTNGENRFGHKTPPNGVFTIIVALILPAIMVLGIVAAIAIPAYQAYLQG